MFPSSWKRDFASGLVVLVPVLATMFVIAYLYGLLFGVIAGTGILGRYPNIPTAAYVPLALVFFVLLVLAVGYLMRTTVGDIIERALDDVFNAIPGLRIVYNASKMAAETAFSGTTDLQAPVKLEVWDGLRMTAFKTGKTTDDGRDVLFLPTSPNITTGFVIEVEPHEYTPTNESVEDALTRVLSAGFGENESDLPDELLDEQP
ncbi:hypothetical protein BRC71_07845 [Halobacteriales archaeon QH_7_65_31]|nr:MAG: hypothetical protein BRC71_07845 [Halobacteriales archaeon QH_7_65_31]PSQ30276.1 MAG: hypothetical protein BRD16_07000 [Halobacteriales archaeon SW_6_65_46]